MLNTEKTSIKALLHVSSQRLKSVTEIPQKEALILLSFVLQKEISWLIAHQDDEIDVEEVFYEKLERRVSHEPLEYILGTATFYGRVFDVDSRVLIPRPETELLVDHVVSLVKDIESPHIVEIGCGSGIISIMLALLLPDATLTAVDISKDALDVSRHNAKQYGVHSRIMFVHGSYLDGVDEQIDVIVSNPPYIAHDASLGRGLAFEPSLALFGGKRGDEMLKHIINLYVEKKAKVLVCEMGYDQRESLEDDAFKKGLVISFYTDLAGLDRGFWIKENV